MKIIFTFKNSWFTGRFNIIVYPQLIPGVMLYSVQNPVTSLTFARGIVIFMWQRYPNAEIVRGNTYIIKYIIKQRLLKNISINLENDCVLWTIFPTMKSLYIWKGTYIDLNTEFDTAGRNVVEYHGMYIYSLNSTAIHSWKNPSGQPCSFST